MITTALVGMVASVFTISSYFNTAGNTTNLAYDQQIVKESLNEMDTTVRLLREKAEEEPDPVKREEKLLIADKLSQTHDKMEEVQSQMIVRTARKEFANIVKGTVIGNVDRISKIGELGGQVAGILDGSVDAAVSTRGMLTQGTVDDIRMWQVVAQSSESLDVEIAKVKARQQAKELAGLSDDLASMINDLERQERELEISPDQYESELGKLVNQYPASFGIGENALDGLDTDTGTNEESTNNYVEPTANPGKSGSVVGQWEIIKSGDQEPEVGMKLRYQQNWYELFSDGTATQISGAYLNRFTYTMDSDGQGVLTVVDVTLRDGITKDRAAGMEYAKTLADQRVGKQYCFYLSGEEMKMYVGAQCGNGQEFTLIRHQ